MTSQPGVRVGTAAPPFELPDQHGAPTSLAEVLADRHALLFFYPFAFSGICTSELSSLQRHLSDVQDDLVQVLAISCDSMYATRAFSAAEGLDFPLLSDFWPHGAAARAYGVFDETAGMPVRGTFVVDRSGVVRWSQVNSPGEARDITTVREAARSILS